MKQEKMKQTEIGEIPESWNIANVGQLAEFSRGVSWRGSESNTEGNGIAVVSIPNIKKNIDFSSIKHFLEKKINNKKYLKQNDILFVGSSGSIHNVARSAIVKEIPFERATYASFTFRAHPDTDAIIPEFLFYSLNSNKDIFSLYIDKAADGKYNFQLRNFADRAKVPVPPLVEQKKIAAVLSKIQKNIDIKDELIKVTQELKKSTMNYLFTYGTQGEKTKQTEIGETPKSWNIANVGQLAEFSRGVSWRGSESNTEGNGIAVVSIPNIKKDIDFSGIKHFLEKKINEKKYLKQNDILFVGSSGSIHNVARSAIVKEIPFEKATYASFTFRAHPDTDAIIPEFLFYLLNGNKDIFSSYIDKAADGKYNFQLRNFVDKAKISMPPLAEQKKIASILCKIDERIQNYEAQKHTLQALFKSMLSKLMTGQIRVHELDIDTAEIE